MNHNEERYPGNKIHETAVIYDGVLIGTGNEIGPFCIIGGPAEWKGKELSGFVSIGNNNTITGLATIDGGVDNPTIIGSNCYIMKGVHIGHDAYVGNNVTLSCHCIIGGHTAVMDHCNLGLGSIVHQKQKIEEGVMLGMGSIVTKKLVTEPYKTYVGSPARLLGDNVKHSNYTIYLNDTL